MARITPKIGSTTKGIETKQMEMNDCWLGRAAGKAPQGRSGFRWSKKGKGAFKEEMEDRISLVKNK